MRTILMGMVEPFFFFVCNSENTHWCAEQSDSETLVGVTVQKLNLDPDTGEVIVESLKWINALVMLSADIRVIV